MRPSRRVWCVMVSVWLLATSAAADPLLVQQLDDPDTAVAEGASIDALVASLFSGTTGSAIDVVSVTYTGAFQASGLFSGSGDIIGIDNGVLLTSGHVANVVGPNDSDSASSENGAAGSAALNALIGQSTNDASVLDLTIVPQGQTLQFSYVFGSEEYNEYVNSSFNDVFAFFVNGVNHALIPGTDIPVAINNINIGNPTRSACVNCAFYVNNDDGAANTQLDAFTTVLSFIAPVNPGEVNTLSLQIADASDSSYDSAVFIQGGSVAAPGSSAADPILPTATDEDGFVFNFFVVDPTIPIFIDPIVAIGYDFVVNAGPNVQTVTLPNIGDGLFDIYDAASNLLANNWMWGVPFDFGLGGIDAFTILGIEPFAGLDPTDPLAFVAALTFTGPGQVNLNMNPVTQQVPEPATVVLIMGGLAAAAMRRRSARTVRS